MRGDSPKNLYSCTNLCNDLGMSQAPVGSIPAWNTGDRLRKSLDHVEMSVQEMADYLEVSRNTVGNYISGRRPIPGAMLKLWALRTGVPRVWLETGETPTQPEGPDGGLAVVARSEGFEPPTCCLADVVELHPTLSAAA